MLLICHGNITVGFVNTYLVGHALGYVGHNTIIGNDRFEIWMNSDYCGTMWGILLLQSLPHFG